MQLLLDTSKIYKNDKSFILELINIDLTVKKRQTALGVYWKIIFSSIAIIVLGVVFNKGFYRADNYIVYLAANYFMWQFINDTISDSPRLFEQNKNLLLNNNVSPIILNIRNFLINLYIYLFTTIILLTLTIYFDTFNTEIILSIFALALILMNTYLVSISVAYLQSKFSDVESLVRLFLLLLFFLTPIIWSENILQDTAKYIIQFNPLYHFFKIFNQPILNAELGYKYFFSLCICVIITFINLIIANKIFSNLSKKVKNYL